MEQLTREKEWIERDLQLKTEESQQVMKKKNQLEKELQTANTQSQQQVQQFKQQVSDVIVTIIRLYCSHFCSCRPSI